MSNLEFSDDEVEKGLEPLPSQPFFFKISFDSHPIMCRSGGEGEAMRQPRWKEAVPSPQLQYLCLLDFPLALEIPSSHYREQFSSSLALSSQRSSPTLFSAENL